MNYEPCTKLQKNTNHDLDRNVKKHKPINLSTSELINKRYLYSAIFNFQFPINMNWIMLIIAGLFEVGFTTCLGKAKAVEGAAAAWWMGGFFVCLTLSMLLLYKATQTLPLGTAYAVWTGIGAVGTAIIGIIFFKEPSDWWRLFFITTLIASIIGLKFVSH